MKERYRYEKVLKDVGIVTPDKDLGGGQPFHLSTIQGTFYTTHDLWSSGQVKGYRLYPVESWRVRVEIRFRSQKYTQRL